MHHDRRHRQHRRIAAERPGARSSRLTLRNSPRLPAGAAGSGRQGLPLPRTAGLPHAAGGALARLDAAALGRLAAGDAAAVIADGGGESEPWSRRIIKSIERLGSIPAWAAPPPHSALGDLAPGVFALVPSAGIR